MRKRKALLCVLFTSVILISGCSDIKNIEDVNFATALGLDYKDGKYIGYVQMLDFSNVAKKEGGWSGPANIYVAKGEGHSPTEAINKIMFTSQSEFFLGHVNAIVFSENVIKHGSPKVMDSFVRHPEFSLTPWIFGTKDPIEQIFNISGFYNSSALGTILLRPLENYEYFSTIRPKKLYQFTRELFEPHYTTYLPSLHIHEKQWKVNGENEPKLAYNGAFFIQNQNYKGFFKTNELKGFRWVVKGTKSVNLPIPSNKKPSFTAHIGSPKINYKEKTAQNTTKMRIMIKGKGIILQRDTDQLLRLSEIEKGVNTEIKKEIEKLYKLGIKKNIDFLNIEHELFRQDYKKWKEVFGKDDISKRPDILQKVDVSIKIKNSTSLKNKKLDLKNIK